MTDQSHSQSEALLALALRCEQASGDEERELIQAAYEALRPEEMCWPDRLYDLGGAASIAMSLVPERWWCRMTFGSGASAGLWHLERRVQADAATPALALTAASLRARAETPND